MNENEMEMNGFVKVYDYSQYAHDNNVNVIPEADFKRLVSDTFRTIPDTSLRAHQIRLPYLTFLELYKPEIVNILQKRDGITLIQAINKWSKAQMEFSESVYEVMNYILKNTKHGVRCLVNRNP